MSLSDIYTVKNCLDYREVYSLVICCTIASFEVYGLQSFVHIGDKIDFDSVDFVTDIGDKVEVDFVAKGVHVRGLKLIFTRATLC